MKQMGFFGSAEGHIDSLDSSGSLTTMVVASRLPDTYEGGRIHLLALGVYVKLNYLNAVAFSGLNKHGGTPPIAPPNTMPLPSAARGIWVCYPPESMMNGASDFKVHLASLGKGLLVLPPEVTSRQ